MVAVCSPEVHHREVPGNGPPLDWVVDGDLPVYVTEPGRPHRETIVRHPAGWSHSDWASSFLRPSTRVTPPSGLASGTKVLADQVGGIGSPCFHRVIDVPGDALGVVLGEWWAQRATPAGARLSRSLVVTDRQLERGLWTLRGRLRRGVGRRPVPVALELWPHLGRFTRLTLTPRSRVFASRHYFKVVNKALDSLARELVGRSRGLPLRTPSLSTAPPPPG